MTSMTVGLIAAGVGILAKAAFVVTAGYTDRIVAWLTAYGSAGPPDGEPAPYRHF